MDKVKVNNQVIFMRKFVKQAKVRIINKLVKDVKSLQVKKGTEAQLEKNKRKIERVLKEIEIIKKINVDALSKMALMKGKDWQSILSNKEVSIEERALALVASCEAIQGEVEKFHIKEPGLVSRLNDLFKQWEQRKSDPHAKHFKGMKASEFRKLKKEKRRKNKGENQPRSNRAHISFNQVDSTFQDSEHNRQPAGASCEVLDNTVKQISQENAAASHVVSDVEENNDLVSASDEKNQPSHSLLNKTCKKKKHLKEIAVLNLNELKEDEPLSLNRLSSEEEDDEDGSSSENENRCFKKDPFFVSANESICDEKSTSDVEEANPLLGARVDRSEAKKNFGKHKMHNRPSQKPYFSRPTFGTKSRNQGDKQKFSSHSPGKNFPRGAKPRIKNKFKHKTERGGPARANFNRPHEKNKGNLKSFPQNYKKKMGDSFKQSSSPPKVTGVNLHPSWEAKRKLKMKSSIVPSQAKKIKFDD